MTDSRFESCILQIRQGGREGLREIYEEYYKLIFSVMLAVVSRREEAEDLTSDFFLKLWDKLAEAYKPGRGHKTWLVTAARNMAIDRFRRNSRVELSIDQDEENSASHDLPSGENLEENVISDITVRQALAALDPREREIVSLKLFSELTFKEIARVLSVPQGTVAWRYRGAIKKLSVYFEEVGRA